MVSGQFGLGEPRAERGVPHVLRTQLRQSHRRITSTCMRVAIEAASLSLTSGGLARYTSELSLALARSFPADEFYLISDQPRSEEHTSELQSLRHLVCPLLL